MKILLVTGQLAKELVASQADKVSVDVSVEVMPIPVASLMKPAYIARRLKASNLSSFDMILTPGLMAGDVGIIEQATGIPTYKGPRHAADIPALVNNLSKVKLSKTRASDDVIKDYILADILKTIRDPDLKKDQLLKKPGNLLLGTIPAGSDFPPRIMAEIVDAPTISDNELRRRALYYVNAGADIIDVGMVANVSQPSEAYRAVKAVIEAVDRPVSVDTLDPEEAKAAVRAGASIIVSADAGNMDQLASFAKDKAVVVIPTDFSKGYFPKKAKERVTLLEKNISRARDLGFTRILADPILDPLISPGMVESAVAFHWFRSRNPHVPLFMGVGNITELADVDTAGANGVLAGMAAELGVAVLLTTEVSNKARGSVQELATASKMMYAAKMRGSPPKDMGLNLLYLRDRSLRDEPRPGLRGARIIKVASEGTYRADPKGWFKIHVDRELNLLNVLYYDSYAATSPKVVITGRSVLGILRKICSLGLVSRLDHAAYLGTELQKADVALRLGRSFRQDCPLWS